MAKVLYKPLGLLAGVLGGIIASAVFNQIWKLIAGEDEAPEALDRDRRWSEVLPAAALQGAVFALVKAALERGGAVGVEKATGTWPG